MEQEKSYQSVRGTLKDLQALEAILKTAGYETELELVQNLGYGALYWRKPASDTKENTESGKAKENQTQW